METTQLLEAVSTQLRKSEWGHEKRQSGSMDQEEGKQKRVRVLVSKSASLFIVLFDFVFFFFFTTF